MTHHNAQKFISTKLLLSLVEQNREHLDAIRRNLGVPDDESVNLDLRIILLCLKEKAENIE